MGGLAAWLARWGRVLLGYAAFLAAIALVIQAVDALLGISIPSVLDSGRLWSTFMGYLGDSFSAVASLRNKPFADTDLANVIMYCVSFDGLESALSLFIGCLSAFISTIAILATAAFTTFGYMWACRKVSWLGNATAGVKVGD